jgi:putative endonuclease
MHYVYILKLDNGDCYTGYTTDLEERIAQHDRGSTASTRSSVSHRLLFYAAFSTKIKALAFEKYLKSSSGHAFRKKRLL